MFKSTLWNVKLANDERISVDVTYDTDGGEVTVDVIGDGWIEKRKGTMVVERAVSGPVFFAVVKSLGGDVKGEGRNARQAAEDYGSKVAQAVVEQRQPAVKPEVELLEELLEEILGGWRESSRTSASIVERMAINIVNLRAVRKADVA